MRIPPIVPIRSDTPSARHPHDGDGSGEADDRASGPTRRDLVKWLAAAAALANGGCSRPPRERIYSYAHAPELEANGASIYYASASVRSGFAHGVLIATQQGRPIKVEGNPLHPASLGATDPAEQAAVLQLWDPDRSQTPWERITTARGRPATWVEFEKAWRQRAASSGGEPGKLHMLTGRFTSPLLAAQLATLLAAHPGARWHRYDAVDGDAAREAARLAFGQPLRAVWHLDRVDTVVTLGVDPFSARPDAVRNASDWARGRAAAIAAGQPPPRAIALETAPSLFGARADERFALTPMQIEAVLWRAVSQIAPELIAASEAALKEPLAGAPVTSPMNALQVPLPVIAQAAVGRLTALLKQPQGRTLLCAGETLSAASQALAHRLNRRGEAFVGQAASGGACIELISPPDDHPTLPPPAALGELITAMKAGEVDTLLILGGNPVYAAARALGFDEALSNVPFSVHLSAYRDETSERCRWHLPLSHDFETWSDARAFDGSLTLIQPAITPLYDTRSAHELLAMLLPREGDAAADGHALLRAHWRLHRQAQGRAGVGDETADAGFERFWNESLRAGVAAGSQAAPIRLDALVASAGSPLAPPIVAPAHAIPDALWAVFPPDASVGDGSLANNGWLQELPRPFTKITWGNALQIGPGTAASLGLTTGDIVRLLRANAPASGASAGRDRPVGVEVPVWVQTGHAEAAVTLPLGYGRRAAGRVGNGVGVDTAALRDADGAPAALYIERTGQRHAFALTQVEMGQHGRDLARTMSAASLHEVAFEAPKAPSLYPAIEPGATAWAMVIDLDACIGCNACTIACQAENNIPVVGAEEVRQGRSMHWIRVDNHLDAEGGAISQPVPCMHCENAPCELVCPVGATVHDSEGLNVQVYNRCIGTRFCSNNCPYKVRRFNFRQYSDVTTETFKLMRNPDVTVRDRGVMEKCNYCLQRLSRARRETQKTGAPLPTDEVVTACQASCPTRAIHFGNLSDPASDVVRQRASPRHYAMLEELNTRPRTTYLARVGEPRDTDGDGA